MASEVSGHEYQPSLTRRPGECSICGLRREQHSSRQPKRENKDGPAARAEEREIEALIRESVAAERTAEREACAKLADKNGHYGTATEIRSRK